MFLLKDVFAFYVGDFLHAQDELITDMIFDYNVEKMVFEMRGDKEFNYIAENILLDDDFMLFYYGNDGEVHRLDKLSFWFEAFIV